MQAANRLPLSNLRQSRSSCIVALFCAATAITSPGLSFTTVHNFNGTDGNGPIGLLQANDGDLYGTTYSGGANNSGTVFKISPTGTLNTLYNFCSQPACADGSGPSAPLLQATDGNFYGTTFQGGTTGFGTIFKITAGGTLSTLYNFQGGESQHPGSLVQTNNGNFYGVTEGVVSNNCPLGCGTIFRFTAGGAFSTVHTFSGPDGSAPLNGMIQGTDGNLYGTTDLGGANGGPQGYGTIFKVSSDGIFTTLHSFNQTDGANPDGLVEGIDGNLYGTAEAGGINNNCDGGTNLCGTVFEISLGGTLTTLYTFSGSDGSNPIGGLVQATDGNFYGTTSQGGNEEACNFGCGTVFEITPAGVLTTLHLFDVADGSSPLAAPVQATDGNFYGTTYSGGVSNNCSGGCGTVFGLTGPSPTAVQFVPATPCRLADTRQGSPIQGGTWEVFVVPQLGGCNIPTTATAYSLNITVVPREPLGYLTIWPAERTQPYVSTMNSPDGRIKANAAIVPAGAAGAVNIYVTDTTDVILDIDGYFQPPSSQTLQFYPLAPCRIIDTRNGQDGGTLLAGMERDYALAGTCGIPSSAAAYSLNVTVIPAAGGLDYLTVWPAGETRPTVSTLNDNTGTVLANAAIVPAGSDNRTAFYPNSNDTDLLVDVNGYFASPGGGYSFYPNAPCRAYDSRSNNGRPFTGQITVNIAGSPCAPASNAVGYVFNATVVPSGSLGYLTLWPDPGQQPTVSTLNAHDGFITSNMAIVPNTDGSIDAYAGYGYTQLILDISGYFAP